MTLPAKAEPAEPSVEERLDLLERVVLELLHSQGMVPRNPRLKAIYNKHTECDHDWRPTPGAAYEETCQKCGLDRY